VIARDAVTLFVRRALGLCAPIRVRAREISAAAFRCLSPAFALGFRREVLPVISGIGIEAPAFQLDDARRDAVEEEAVMRDEQAGAGVVAQEILQPLDALRVEVFVRFVEE